jgi:hypothetical protein
MVAVHYNGQCCQKIHNVVITQNGGNGETGKGSYFTKIIFSPL